MFDLQDGISYEKVTYFGLLSLFVALVTTEFMKRKVSTVGTQVIELTVWCKLRIDV